MGWGRKRAAFTLMAATALLGGMLAFIVQPAAKAANPGDTAGTDPVGDTTDPHADITNFSIAYGGSIVVQLHVVAGTNPTADQFVALWGLDTNGDGQADFVALSNGGQAEVDHNDDNGTKACDAIPGWDGGGTYTAVFAPSCIGSPANLSFQSATAYFPNPQDTSTFAGDTAPNGSFVGPVSPPRSVNTAGIVVDDWGGLHAYHEGSGTLPTFAGGPYWPGQDVARGVAAIPGQGGVEVDDWGGLHTFSINGSPVPGAPQGGPYWPGQNVARGVAVLSDGSGGYVVDDWGALHPFSLGGGTPPAAPNNVSYWPGQDVVRGVAVVGSSQNPSGWTLDSWGGIHPFGSAPALDATLWGPGLVFRGLSVTP